MNKHLLALFCVTIVIGGIVFANGLYFSLAKTGTQVVGTFSLDTSWTQANSPYTLTGDILVNTGATLTVEAGVTVNLNSYNIEVKGTFYAKGNSTNNINLNAGIITFTKASSNWDEQTSSGCIIENAIINATQIIIHHSPKINNNTILSAPDYEITVWVGSPIISNNIFPEPATIYCGGSALITNNTITNLPIGSYKTRPYSYGIVLCGYFNGSGNSGTVTVSNNNMGGIQIINGCIGTMIVENNLITGIFIGTNNQITIQNNTITYGLYIQTDLTFAYNNILHNDTSFSIHNNYQSSVNAAYNWWGTTDGQAINQSIKYNGGTVTFTPFLTLPNLKAPPIPANIVYPTPTPPNSSTPTEELTPLTTPSNTPKISPSITPSYSPTQIPTLEPTQTASPAIPGIQIVDYTSGIILFGAIIGVAIAVLVYVKKRRL